MLSSNVEVIMILEIKAIFKDKEKARKAFERIRILNDEHCKEVTMNSIDDQGNPNRLVQFNYQDFFKSIARGFLLGGLLGACIFYFFGQQFISGGLTELGLMLYIFFTGIVTASITSMIFFIQREYRISLSPKDLEGKNAVLSVICDEHAFLEIENLLKNTKPAHLLVS